MSLLTADCLPRDQRVGWRRLSRAERARDAAPAVSLFLIPVLVVVSVLLVLWIKEPDPVSADPARATLAELGPPAPGATLRSELTADWPRCGTDGACVTAGRIYQLTGSVTLDGVVRDLQSWAARGRLGLADAQPSDCNDLSPSSEVDSAPGPTGPGCVVGFVLPDRPDQRLTVNIMFRDSTPVALLPGGSWTSYAGKTVATVVIDVTNIRPGTD
jgi:hypothetical protein